MRTILAYGDSNTWGLIPGTAPAGRFPFSVRWTGRLQALCGDTHIIEEGLCGRTVALDDAERPGRNGFETLPLILESHHPLDAAIVMLGTNDCKKIFAKSSKDIGQAMASMLEVFEKYLPAEKILLISPPYLGDLVWLPEKDPAFDKRSIQTCLELTQEYQKIAREHGAAFLASSAYVKASGIDDEHIDGEGHRLFADAVFEKLKEMGVLVHTSSCSAGKRDEH